MACRIRIKGNRDQRSEIGGQRSEVGGQGSGVGRSHEGKKYRYLADSRGIKEETMLIRCLTLIGLIAALLVFSGCGTRETMLDKNWGSSFESAKQSQILNPEAGRNLEPVVGLDGQAAGNNMEKYRQGFKKDTSKEMTLTIQDK
jgi:hypothetical protein